MPTHTHFYSQYNELCYSTVTTSVQFNDVQYKHSAACCRMQCFHFAVVFLRLDVESSLMADAWALKKINDYQDGKILLWAWISRGLITMEQVAGWRFNGDVEQVKQLLEGARGELSKLCDLDKLECVDDSGMAPVVTASETACANEICSAWAMVDPEVPDAKPILLPSWFTAPIDRAVLMWKQESSIWQKRLQKRKDSGHSDFAPKAKEAFRKWKDEVTRRIVLNKKTQTQMVKIADKSIRQLKRHCLMLEIHMSHNADELAISAGSGKLWRLCLMQGTLPASGDVPPEVDHFEGDNATYSTYGCHVF